MIKALLSCSASVDYSTAGGGTSGATPLMLAANFAHSAVCRQLLEAGASLSREANGYAWNGFTATTIAREKGNRDVIQVLEDWAEEQPAPV